MRRPTELLLAALLAAAPMAAAHGDRATEYRFRVFYDGSRIGTHEYTVVEQGNAVRVQSFADFRVKALFVTLYRYRHRAEELWQGGCLTALASVTDDNGQRHRIRAATPEGRLLLTAAEAPPNAPDTRLLEADCPATFAYWDIDRLRHPRLINTQTGASSAAVLTEEGAEQRDGRPAVRYRLDVEELPPITLWYARGDGRWLGLATRRGDGELVYRLESMTRRPASAVQQDAGIEDPPGIEPTFDRG